MVGRRTLAFALTAALAAVAPPASAAAGPVVKLRTFPGPELKQGPFLTSAGVGWTQARCIGDDCEDEDVGASDQLFLVRSSGAPGRIRTLFRARARHDSSGPNAVGEGYFAWLSGRALAVLRTTSNARFTLWAGRPVGPLTQLFDCVAGTDMPIALDGRTLVYEPDPCAPPVRLAVRNVPSGETRVVPLGEAFNPVALQVRGRFAAWVRYQPGGLHIVVFDLTAGTTVHAVPIDPPAGWTLGPDGTVAATTGDTQRPCHGKLWRFSIAEPVPHELAEPACIGQVRISDQRIFFFGPRGESRFLRSVGTAGDVRDHVRFGRVAHRDFDVRGTRVAWAARDCAGGDAIFTGSLRGHVLGVGRVSCPTRLAAGPAPVRRGGAELGVRCPRGCSAHLSLLRRGRLVADRVFDLAGSARVTLPLRPAARRAIERHGSLRVRVVLIARDRAYRQLRTVRGLLLVLRER
jgi:hypothetical protein